MTWLATRQNACRNLPAKASTGTVSNARGLSLTNRQIQRPTAGFMIFAISTASHAWSGRSSQPSSSRGCRLVWCWPGLLLGLLWLAGCAPPSEPPRTADGHLALSGEALARHDAVRRAIHRQQFDEALSLLDALITDQRQHTELRVDRALALFGRNRPGDAATAQGELRTVLSADPKHARARYLLALLQLREGDPASAGDALARLRQEYSDDPHLVWFEALARERQGHTEMALVGYLRAAELDPLFASAWQSAFEMARALDDAPRARTLLQRRLRLNTHPQARFADFIPGRLGPMAKISPLAAAEPAQPITAKMADPDAEQGPPSPFADPRLIARLFSSPAHPGITLIDINDDGLSDLFISHAEANAEQPSRLLLAVPDNDTSNAGTPITRDWKPSPEAAPWQHTEGVQAALWGDLDGDGRVDLYLCRDGLNQLWTRREGQWQETAESAKATGPDALTRDGRLLDLDQDGDLDLVLIEQDEPPLILHNDGRGKFQTAHGDFALPLHQPLTQLTAADIDRDRDLDLLVLRADGQVQELRNLGRGRFAARRPNPARARALVLSDRNADGLPDLLELSDDGRLRLRMGGSPLPPLPLSLPPADGRMAAADFLGTGDLQLVLSGARGLYLIDFEQGETRPRFRFGEQAPAAWQVITDSPEGPGLMVWQDDRLIWLAHRPDMGRFVSLSLDEVTSNSIDGPNNPNAGLGTWLALHNGEQPTATTLAANSSLPGQGLAPWSFGTGAGISASEGAKAEGIWGQAGMIDAVQIEWPNGQLQTLRDLNSRGRQRITRSPRRAARGPVLFAYEGDAPRLVTDLLGGAEVDPDPYEKDSLGSRGARQGEWLMLPKDLLQPIGDRLILELLETEEQVSYLDEARLIQLDLPPDWSALVDGRLNSHSDPAKDRLHYYASALEPTAAYFSQLSDTNSDGNTQGSDQRERLLERDGIAADLGEPDAFSPGRLRHPARLTLEFPRLLDQPGRIAWLLGDAWLGQQQSPARSFSSEELLIEARDDQGNWLVLPPITGLPGGMERELAFPLVGMPPESRALRLTSDAEIHWDRLRLVFTEPQPSARVTPLALLDAQLIATGYPALRWLDQGRIVLDPTQAVALADRHIPAGFYPPLGDVQELIQTSDDALAILGPGEAIRLEYRVPPNPPSPGWSRRWLLEIRGAVRRYPPGSATGLSIYPLPAGNDPDREELHRRYHTRYRGGR